LRSKGLDNYEEKVLVNSFVKVRLENVDEENLSEKKSLADEGINPEWNENISIPY